MCDRELKFDPISRVFGEMEKIAILALILGLCVSQLGGSVATPANATFYGGSDASGTMGM